MASRRRYLASYRNKSDIAAAIKRLPSTLQVALALLYCDELNIAEIAAVMRLTERKTRRLLKLAHERLGFSGANKDA